MMTSQNIFSVWHLTLPVTFSLPPEEKNVMLIWLTYTELLPMWECEVTCGLYLRNTLIYCHVQVCMYASMWIKTVRPPCWPPRYQQVWHQRWIWGFPWKRMRKHASEGIHTGFETQRRRYQKSKMRPRYQPRYQRPHKKDWCPPEIYEKIYCDFCVLAEPSWSSTRWYPLLGGRTGNDISQLHLTSGGRSWVLLSPKIYVRSTTFAVSRSGRTTRFRWGIRSV